MATDILSSTASNISVEDSTIIGSTVIEGMSQDAGQRSHGRGYHVVGGLTGRIDDTTISDSSVKSVIVLLQDTYISPTGVGAFTGQNSGTISQSSVITSVVHGVENNGGACGVAHQFAGGFAGISVHGTIEDSFIAATAITGPAISDSGEHCAGGIFGTTRSVTDGTAADNTTTVSRVYSDASVTSNQGKGIHGDKGDDTTITLTSVYYNKEKAAATPLQQGAKTLTQLKAGTPGSTIYTGWSTNIWNFGTATELPILR